MTERHDLNDWEHRIIEEFHANGATLAFNSLASPYFCRRRREQKVENNVSAH